MKKDVLTRLMDRTVKQKNGCWEWQGTLTYDGYGRWGINKKKDGVHRSSYKIFKGEIPKGLFVCHTCDNRKCVNPDHLWLGTNKDNLDDMRRKGRQPKLLGHRKLTIENVKEIRASYFGNFKTVKHFSKKFNVRNETISKIVHNKSWKVI